MVETREPSRLLLAAPAVLVALSLLASLAGATLTPGQGTLTGPAFGAPLVAVGERAILFRDGGQSLVVEQVDGRGAASELAAADFVADTRGAPAVAIDGQVYLFARTGQPAFPTQVYRFNPERASLEAGALLPFLPTTATTLAGEAYLVGTCAPKTCSGNATARFSPRDESFTILAAHAGPVADAVFVGLELLVPVAGRLPGQELGQHWRLDPATGQTTPQPGYFAVALRGMTAVELPCGILAFGGANLNGATNLIQLLDARSGISGVLEARLPAPAAQPTAVVVGNTVYLVGLGSGATGTATFQIDELCAERHAWSTPIVLDTDGDGLADASDNCPALANDQSDADQDGTGDACDPTPAAPATPATPAVTAHPANQVTTLFGCAPGPDIDLDGLADPCDPDMDGDGVPDKGPPRALLDLCPRVPDALQTDTDHDGAGDACDTPVLVGKTSRLHGRALTPVSTPALLAPRLALLVAVAGAGAAWLWRHRLGAIAIVGFTRLRGDELAEQPVRRQILQLVSAQPGIHHQEMRRRLGIGRGNLDHHVQVLLRAGHLREHRGSGYRCYFPPGTNPNSMRSSGVLKSELAQRLLEQVTASPGCAVSELARRTEADYRSVAYHLERFEGAGVAHLRHDGITMRAYPAATYGAVTASAK